MRAPIAVALALYFLVSANLFAGYSRAQELLAPRAEELAAKYYGGVQRFFNAAAAADQRAILTKPGV